jgi:hypothetical protein
LSIGSTLLLSGSRLAVFAADAPEKPSEVRCGWFENSSPGNASLTDRDGEWTVAMQGEFSAKGKWPKFKDSQWVRPGNGSAGYGCACLTVTENVEEHTITAILSSHAKALSVCRRDKTLTEPDNPLN